MTYRVTCVALRCGCGVRQLETEQRAGDLLVYTPLVWKKARVRWCFPLSLSFHWSKFNTPRVAMGTVLGSMD
jgi:hypothetical protein